MLKVYTDGIFVLDIALRIDQDEHTFLKHCQLLYLKRLLNLSGLIWYIYAVFAVPAPFSPKLWYTEVLTADTGHQHRISCSSLHVSD